MSVAMPCDSTVLCSVASDRPIAALAAFWAPRQGDRARDALPYEHAILCRLARKQPGGPPLSGVPRRRATFAPDPMTLPAPTPELHRAMQIADFASPPSMRALQDAVTTYARALRVATASQSVISSTVRAVVDDSLPTRVVVIRTSEDRARLLALVAEWSALPTL